jgi:hypothetical protein
MIIRLRTIAKFVSLCHSSIEKNRLLTVDEIIQETHHCRSHAYNYYNALRCLFPLGPIDPNKPVVPYPRVPYQTNR